MVSFGIANYENGGETPLIEPDPDFSGGFGLALAPAAVPVSGLGQLAAAPGPGTEATPIVGSSSVVVFGHTMQLSVAIAIAIVLALLMLAVLGWLL